MQRFPPALLAKAVSACGEAGARWARPRCWHAEGRSHPLLRTPLGSACRPFAAGLGHPYSVPACLTMLLLRLPD